MNVNKKVSLIKQIINIIRWIIFGILCVVFVFQILLLVFVSKDDMEETRLPILVFEVTSGSMYPNIKVGDGVVDIRTPYEKLEVGNVITFYRAGDLVTHKITSINDMGIVQASGTYPLISETPVERKNYVGRMILKIPALSKFLSMTYETWKKFVWIAVIIFVLFAPELIYKLTDNNTLSKKKK